jgi:hypothetical protein
MLGPAREFPADAAPLGERGSGWWGGISRPPGKGPPHNQLALPLPEHLRGGAAQKVIGAFLAKGLLAEVAAGRGDPVWHENEDGQAVTLVATEAAPDALGIEPADGPTGARTAATATGESP